MTTQSATLAITPVNPNRTQRLNLSFWRDLHKEVYGCRPTFTWHPTEDEYDVEIERLGRLLAIHEEMNRKAALASQYKFERTVEYLIRRGDAQNRSQAIREIVEQQHDRYAFKLNPGERPDWEYIAYGLKLPTQLAEQLRLDYEGGL